MNITEDYCSYEVAKLLKEKGFDQNCATYYLDGQVWRHHHVEVIPKNKQIYAAPTQQMAMRWLREERNLNIEPYFEYLLGYSIDIKYTDKKTNIERFEELREKWFNTYEEAVEAAIKYCLENLI